MKNRRIVIASVLKPIDDTRMFEKMALSLCESHDCEVTIMGQSIHQIPAHPGIEFIPFEIAGRFSLDRFLTPTKILLTLFKVRPGILIVNTHELLIVSVISRILFGCVIVYDIRENYYRNIRFSETYPARFRLPLSWWIRGKEKLVTRLFHHVILAENSYATELGFIGKHFTILENKAIQPKVGRRTSTGVHKLLFTGTISKSTGVFEAITLATVLHKEDPEVRLMIAGYCALPSTRLEVLERIRDKPFILLKGFYQLLPHREIMAEIENADFGIMYYPPSPHTSGSVPTKLFEYMANQLPIITWANQPYAPRVMEQNAGLLWDVPPELLNKMKTQSFYPKRAVDVYWEGKRFSDLMEKLAL
ncbi:MAG TPA: glycosyltransferase [Cyclobacteriaceae bacterium]